MDRVSIGLTVYFEDPFWVGVFQRTAEGKTRFCKVTFGAEPKDYEVAQYLLKHYVRLPFGPEVQASERQAAHNSKRDRREARRQVRAAGAGTKAQQALARQRELQKTERRMTSRADREEEEKHRFEERQRKKKEKHKGR